MSCPKVSDRTRHSVTPPTEKIEHGAKTRGVGGNPMQTTLSAVVQSYLHAKRLARATRNEYLSTVRKWDEWGHGVPIQELGRKNIREFLDWIYERAIRDEGINPGRTANKAREHLRAVISWAWE